MTKNITSEKGTATRIAVEGELSIFTVAAQRACLLDAFGAGLEVEVDLSRVSEFDTAGLQLMVAARREAAARDTTLRFTGHSPAVLDLLELCAVAEQFGDRADRSPDLARALP